MTDEQKVKEAISELLRCAVPMTASTRLREDLALDSMNLVELTVIVHARYGVDLGRRAVERKLTPVTVGDVAALMGAS